MAAVKAEIHQYNADAAAVLLEGSCEPEFVPFTRIALFSHYTARTFSNLASHPAAGQLAQMLSRLSVDPSAITGSTETILVAYRDQAKRGWRIDMDLDAPRFNVKPWGFGMLGRGIQGYAPLSVMSLARHLVELDLHDDVFIESLGASMDVLSAMWERGQMTMTGHVQAGTIASVAGDVPIPA